MPRGPRIELAGGIHHVWQRGNNRRVLFTDAGDEHLFLRLLHEVAERFGWRCLAYCLMPNHFHLAIETPEANLGDGMRILCGRYAQLLNEKHGWSGHVYEGRYNSKLVRTDEQLAQLLRYIALNPVAAGLCSDPRAWRASSHRTLAEQHADRLVAAERVVELLEVWGGAPGERYRGLFDEDGPLAHLQADMSPWDIRPTLDEILDTDDLAAAVRRAKRHGYKVAEVAAHLGVSQVTLWRAVKEMGSVPFRERKGLRPLTGA